MLQNSRTIRGAKEPTDIDKLADEYLRLAYHGLRARDKRLAISTSFHRTLGIVILNLIINAFYAINEKKKACQVAPVKTGYEATVSVITEKINNKIQIIVSDNGNGIPAKVLDKIFQPFFITKPTGQGTKLWLSLNYDIVKAYGES